MPTVSQVLVRADYLLKQINQTEGIRRWTRDELHLWVADAVGALYKLDTSAGTVTDTFQLVEGTLQTAPATWDMVTDVVRNKPNNGSYGDAIRLVDRATLDGVMPDWHSQSLSSVIDEWIPGDRKREFYVNPPASVAAYVEARGILAPPVFTSDNDEITVQDLHVEALANYVVYRALSKDAPEGQLNVAAGYYGAFQTAVVGSAK